MQRTDSLITITVMGIDDIVDSMTAITDKIDTKSVLSGVATLFENRLRSATPVGYSGKLPASVLTESSRVEVKSGYEVGVETAGTKPRPRRRAGERHHGKSVLHRNKWVRPRRLEGIFSSTFDAFSGEAVDRIEAGLAEEIERVVS